MFRTPISPWGISRAPGIFIIDGIQIPASGVKLVLVALILTPIIVPAREWLNKKGLLSVLMMDTRAGRDSSPRTGSDRP